MQGAGGKQIRGTRSSVGKGSGQKGRKGREHMCQGRVGMEEGERGRGRGGGISQVKSDKTRVSKSVWGFAEDGGGGG